LDVINLYIINNKLSHFLNVGSHIGCVCLPISLHINKVTAIEACPDTYNHLCDNIKINNILNVKTINIALGNSEEEIYFMSKILICPIEKINRISNNSCGMPVFKDDIKNNKRSSILSCLKIKNKMNKLDNLEIYDFDIILVDIEGYEYEFLLGEKEK
jgi:FkbM family methyltransferase